MYNAIISQMSKESKIVLSDIAFVFEEIGENPIRARRRETHL